jgi:nitrogen fixation/metabolism regulation signal transduction histidine kinase
LLFGFRSLAPGLGGAGPGRRPGVRRDKRGSDRGGLVILATLLGAFAALALSGAAARQLARPIGTLRRGALAVAGGSRAPLNAADAPAEFVPVFRAFDRMARDLATSEAQLSRAERVFAWGEMARQVAHEIKNPLTPIRLGVQHLVRAWHDRRPEFGTILEENAERLLREIDHLDATARSFSQYGTAPGEPAALETFDASLIVRDVAALETIGADGLDWRVVGPVEPHWVRSRRAELREVLLNLCENSRLAGAHRVELSVADDGDRAVITVRDDGEGMTPEVRAKVFDPHFSTRTSGSGLGLAISRRLVEGWGGTIDLESVPGEGTTVSVRLRSAKPGDRDGS